jgi:DNA-binding response OmpR family regulator
MSDEIIKILYIEDEADLVELVTLLLERSGKYKVFSANKGDEGVSIALSEKPDIILLDLMMPNIDGWEVFRQIRENDETKNIPIVIVTAKSQDIDKVLGLEVAGADGYLVKPFDPNELFTLIDELLK